MQKRSIAVMVIAGCTAMMLTGCGVKKEIHEGVVSELNTALGDIDTLKAENAKLTASVDAEKTATREANAQADLIRESLEEKKKELAASELALTSEKNTVGSLEGDLEAEQAKVSSARQATAQVEGELADLQEDYKNLQSRWDQFEKNLNTLDGPAAAQAGPAEDDGKSAADLLNEMMGE